MRIYVNFLITLCAAAVFALSCARPAWSAEAILSGAGAERFSAPSDKHTLGPFVEQDEVEYVFDTTAELKQTVFVDVTLNMHPIYEEDIEERIENVDDSQFVAFLNEKGRLVIRNFDSLGLTNRWTELSHEPVEAAAWNRITVEMRYGFGREEAKFNYYSLRVEGKRLSGPGAYADANGDPDPGSPGRGPWFRSPSSSNDFPSVLSFAGEDFDIGDVSVSHKLWNGKPMVSNLRGATNVLATSAWLTGSIWCAGESDKAAVSVFWGPTDGGTNQAAWANRHDFGERPRESMLTHHVEGLDRVANRFYRFYAANAAGQEAWATTSSDFPGPPEAFATGARMAGIDTALFEGGLIVNRRTPAKVKIYGGTMPDEMVLLRSFDRLRTGSVSYRVRGLFSGVRYYFRVHAENEIGEALSETATFETPQVTPRYGGGTYFLHDDEMEANFRIFNARLSRIDEASRIAEVRFDLHKKHAWRGRFEPPHDNIENWDAVWVFVKFRAPGDAGWRHAWLSTEAKAHHSAANAALDVGTTVVDGIERGMGAFVYSARERFGGAIYRDMSLDWDYGAQGHEFASGDRIEIAVLGIEMVYVPEGAFWAGNVGGVIADSFHSPADDKKPARISSPDAFTLHWGGMGRGRAVIPDSFPNGYAAFYCMKYPLTQGQYAAFLNMLSLDQASERAHRPAAQFRHTISGRHPNYRAGAPSRACNWLTWDDGAAYAAWAGLRPMTELEYEKACRGPLAPVTNEYAWGSTFIENLTTDRLETKRGGDGSGREMAAEANALFGGGIGGPVRVGVFATEDATRVSAGASFWGVMELSGHLSERPVIVDYPAGRAFTGAHGDGTLTLPACWPGAADGGAGFRGGNWNLPPEHLRIASRGYLAFLFAHESTLGWRGVRSAP